MDISSKLALRIGDQIKSAAKAEQDRPGAPPTPPRINTRRATASADVLSVARSDDASHQGAAA
jgi:hypothetical protein